MQPRQIIMNEFDYSYSIGSLEHFTNEGINEFIEKVHSILKMLHFILFQFREAAMMKVG